MIIFGAIQIVLSQIPDFNRLWWLSIVAAIMSFSYSSIGLGLSIGRATGTLKEPDLHHGTASNILYHEVVHCITQHKLCF
jgi:hypothetical protein